MFKYIVYTVTSFRMTNETVQWGDSAEEVGKRFLAMGYVKVEVAPAAPVNGFTGEDPYRSGDTFSRDLRIGSR